MAKGVSLHIGLNTVDPAHYDGWDGELNACEFDANDMEELAKKRGFESRTKILTKEATADRVKSEIERIAGELEAGDFFFCTYSGHGGQVRDTNTEEDDRSDETWLLYDRQLVDDELYALWAKFKPGVRILVLSDSCHSGSVLKNIEDDEVVPDAVKTREKAAAQSPRFRAMPQDVMLATYRKNSKRYDDIQAEHPSGEKAEIGARVLLISGCQDDQLSLDGFSNGLFTETLKTIWDEGAWKGPYPDFHKEIVSKMPKKQQPNFMQVGEANPEFDQQEPFTV
jgi:hypothetical protein